MEDCLICTLKGVADNDNLLGFDEFEIKRTKYNGTFDSDVASLTLRSAEEFTVRVTGGGYFALTYAGLEDPSARLTSLIVAADTNKTLYFCDDDYSIILSNKYDIVRIVTGAQNHGFSLNLGDLVYSTELSELFIPVSTGREGISGDIASLKNTPIEILGTSQSLAYGSTKMNTLIYGDIAQLPNTIRQLVVNKSSKITGKLTDLPAGMTYICVSNTQISGTSTQLGSFTSLSRAMIGGSKISGSVEDFVSSSINNGRASAANLFMYGMFANFTFGGTYLSSNVNQPLRLTYEDLSSTEDRIKIVVMGSTTSYRIWCSGCTSEEIAAWEEDGYTVVAVDGVEPASGNDD